MEVQLTPKPNIRSWEFWFSLDNWIGATRQERMKTIRITLIVIALIFLGIGMKYQIDFINDINKNPCNYVQPISQMCFAQSSNQQANLSALIEAAQQGRLKVLNATCR